MTLIKISFRRAWRSTPAALLMFVALLALAPAQRVWAQEPAGDNAGDVPPSLIEILEQAPKVTAAVVGEDGFAPDEAAASAALPDRTQFGVIDYSVDGVMVNATVTLPASQGVYIASGFPNNNFVNESFIQLGWDNQTGRNASRILLQFDLSPLPPQSRVNSAEFWINQTQIQPPGDSQPMDFRAQLMQQSWNAGQVTWNTANFLGGAAFPLGSIPPAVGWIAGPATDAVRLWLGGEPNRGVIVTGDETPTRGRFRQFNGVGPNSPPDLAPFLSVNFTANCDTAPPVATMNALPTFSPSEFRVFWSAFDPDQPGCPASGVAWFNVQFRINGGGWVNWRNQTPTDNFGFRRDAPNGSLVEFRVQASDNAGNIGAWSPIVATRIDSEPPVASVDPLPQYTIFSAFTVTWSGTDNLSGIAFYNLQMSVNNGAWQVVLAESPATSFQVTGAQFRDQFKFRVQAVDNVGNVQPWSPTAQASTTVFDHPVSRVIPFNPAIIQSTSPVTTEITVNWEGFLAPGTSMLRYELSYRFTPFGGSPGAWTPWATFPGTSTREVFTPGSGNGVYEFFAVAINNFGQRQPFEPESGLGASIILDLDDTIQPRLYLPVMARQMVE
jgi:hypothetical protein